MLGDRRGIGADVEEGFRVAGATHVLSVSGLHLAAVAALLFVLVRAAAARVPRLPLYVDPRAVAAAVAPAGDRVLRAADRRGDRDRCARR